MKSWMWGVAGAVAASVVMLFVTQFFAEKDAGDTAVNDAAIRSIIKEELDAALQVDINGVTFTYGQALSRINHNLVVVQESLEDLSEE